MIGLNYTYIQHKNSILLKNYIIFSAIKNNISKTDQLNGSQMSQTLDLIDKEIADNTLKKDLITEKYTHLFDHKNIKVVMELAYEHEINQKYKREKIDHDKNTNKTIYKLLKNLYGINHIHSTVLGPNINTKKTFNQLKQIKSNDPEEDTKKFFNFVSNILKKHGLTKEQEKLKKWLNQNSIKISKDKYKSSHVTEKGKTLTINLNNNSLVTLYHELTHVTNKIFQTSRKKKTFSKRTISEGYANFIACNCIYAIMNNDTRTISTNYNFYPTYSAIYNQIIKQGVSAKHKQLAIISDNLKPNRTKKENIENIYYRIHKFLDLREYQYLYPKELCYQIGYEKVLKEVQIQAEYLPKIFLGNLIN